MAEESSIPRHPVREHWKERRRRRLESANTYDEEIAQNPELLAEHQCEMKLWDNCLADGLDPEDEEDEEEETDDDASPH